MAKGNGTTRAGRTPQINFPRYAISGSMTGLGFSTLSEILRTLGDSDEDIMEARRLLDRHSEGGAGQEKADNALYELINDSKSSLGKTLRDIARVNEEQYRQNIKAIKDNIENVVAKDFEIERMYTSSEVPDSQVRENIRKRERERLTVHVYRGGARKNTEAWTRDVLGADVGSGIRIPVDHVSTIGDMLKSHYMVGGISQLVGSPSESEVLFIRKKRR